MIDIETEPTADAAKTELASGGGGLTLFCPIRGELKLSGRTADGLTPSEEARRVDAISYLIGLGYEKDYILVKPIIRKLSHGGRNSLRADLAVTNIPRAQVLTKPAQERVKYCYILAEIKRDNAKAKSAKETQVEPLLAFGPPGCLALYCPSGALPSARSLSSNSGPDDPQWATSVPCSGIAS